MNNLTKKIILNGVIAAIYIALTFITYPISFLGIQFRVAEILIFLSFFNPSYIIGLTIGCLISNLASPIGLYDMLFGGLATLITVSLISLLKHLLFGVAIGTVINSLLIGFELFYVLKEPFWLSTFQVALGEFVVLLVGYFIFLALRKRKDFFSLIGASRNIDFKW